MKRIILLALLLFPLCVSAQKDAAALLDKVVAVIKADAALQMDYVYTIYDEDDAVVYSDNGTMKLDNNCYMLDMENMKVWCDGMTQWSYMREVDEVYVTDAASDEAQNLSPLYIMEHYRHGRAVSVVDKGAVAVVKLHSLANAEAESVELHIQKNNNRLMKMLILIVGKIKTKK